MLKESKKNKVVLKYASILQSANNSVCMKTNKTAYLAQGGKKFP